MKLPHPKKSEFNLSGKSRRYWSLMLVGEHGRVIPVRRFKEMAIAIFAVALLSLGALIVLGLLYFRQGQALQDLRSDLAEANQHIARLKDEKDVLSARLGIKKALMQPEVETRTEAVDKADAAPVAQSLRPSKIRPWRRNRSRRSRPKLNGRRISGASRWITIPSETY